MIKSMGVIRSRFIPWVLILIPAFLAGFFYTGFANAFELPKVILFRALILFTLGLGIVDVFLNEELQIPKRYFSSKFVKIVFSSLGVIFLATLFSPQKLNSIFGTYEAQLGLISWGFFGLYFSLCLLYLDKTWIVRGLKFLIFTASLLALYGLAKKIGFDPFFQDYNVDFLEGRIFSTFGNPNLLGQFLAPLIFLSFYFAYKEKKVLYFLLGFIQFVGLLGTKSRAAFLALFLIAILSFFLAIKNKKKFLGVSVGLMGVLILGIHLNLPLLDRFQMSTENFRSLESRFVIWEAAGGMIMDQPFLGIGPDNFSIRFSEYVTPDFYFIEEDLHVSVDRVHNELLEMGVIGGLPLMILYLLLLGSVIQVLFKHSSMESRCLVLTLLLIFIQNQLLFSQVTHYSLFFFLLACLILYESERDLFIWHPSKYARILGLPLLMVFLLWSFVNVVIKPVYAEAWYTSAISSEDPEEGLKKAIYFTPLQAQYRINLLQGFPEERVLQLEALRFIQGNSMDLLTWEASILINIDINAAYALFEKVISMNPSYYYPVHVYAEALYRTGEYSKAVLYYEDFLQVVPDFWKWCPDIGEHSEYEQKKYRIFYKNVPTFNDSLIHLYESYEKSGQVEKAEALKPYLDCLLQTAS